MGDGTGNPNHDVQAILRTALLGQFLERMRMVLNDPDPSESSMQASIRRAGIKGFALRGSAYNLLFRESAVIPRNPGDLDMIVVSHMDGYDIRELARHTSRLIRHVADDCQIATDTASSKENHAAGGIMLDEQFLSKNGITYNVVRLRKSFDRKAIEAIAGDTSIRLSESDRAALRDYASSAEAAPIEVMTEIDCHIDRPQPDFNLYRQNLQDHTFDVVREEATYFGLAICDPLEEIRANVRDCFEGSLTARKLAARLVDLANLSNHFEHHWKGAEKSLANMPRSNAYHLLLKEAQRLGKLAQKESSDLLAIPLAPSPEGDAELLAKLKSAYAELRETGTITVTPSDEAIGQMVQLARDWHERFITPSARVQGNRGQAMGR